MTDDEYEEIILKHMREFTTNTNAMKRFSSPFISAMREAVEKGSIGFANWINDNEHIYGDNWGGGNLSKPAEELYKEYQQSLTK